MSHFDQNLLILMSGGSGSSQPIHQLCIWHLFISVIYIILYYGAQTHKNVAIKISCKLESSSCAILAKEYHGSSLQSSWIPVLLRSLCLCSLKSSSLKMARRACWEPARLTATPPSPSVTLVNTCAKSRQLNKVAPLVSCIPATVGLVVAAKPGCPDAPTNEPLS